MSDNPPNEKENPPKKAPAPKAKAHLRHGAPSTKAEHAALKRADKMVIKRMRKR